MIKFEINNLKDQLFSSDEIVTISIGKIKLHENISVIDRGEIIDIGAYSLIDEQEDDISNLTFTERLNLLTDRDGWIQLAGGLLIEVKKGIIHSIRISKLYLGDLSKTEKETIIQKLGKPDQESKEGITWNLDNLHESNLLIYYKRKIHFRLNSTNNKIKEITIVALDEKTVNE